MGQTIKDCILVERNVSKAIQMLERRMTELSIAEGLDIVASIKDDYNLMLNCFVHGMTDPKGEEVYKSLLKRVYREYCDVRLESIAKRRKAYIKCKQTAEWFERYAGSIRASLEKYVQDAAMTSLLPEAERRKSAKKINLEHQHYMAGLFSYIVMSRQWGEDKVKAFKDMLLTPVVDQNDVLLMVSALTMALLTVFDVNKWIVLVAVYEKSSADAIRQRALVGAMLTLPDEESGLFEEIGNTLANLCASKKIRREIVELQIQMMYCLRTEKDNAEIEHDIMPTFMKNNMRLTRSGIVDDDEAITDVLKNEDMEKGIEDMEMKVRKMREMQKSGIDIFFSGFSHMKRFSFFDDMSNWFTPFYMYNTYVADVLEADGTEFIGNVLQNGSFCDSDKYSFVFALARVMDRLPAGVREMMASSQLPADSNETDKESAAYIRRMYLQDLYRFFALYSDRSDFANPFAVGGGSHVSSSFFVANKNIVGLLGDVVEVVAKFLYKQKYYDEVIVLVRRSVIEWNDNAELSLIMALSLMRLKQYVEARQVFESLAIGRQPSAIELRGLGDSLFMLREYDKAADIYGKLIDAEGALKPYVLRRSLSVINSGKAKEGLADLFRLDYEDGTDMDVKRAIAWGYMMNAQSSEAERLYDMIIDGGICTPDDLLNGGYAKWASGKIRSAVELFGRYADQCQGTEELNMSDVFTEDRIVLKVNGINDYEVTLMLDLVANNRQMG